MANYEGDSLATRGLLAINPSGDGYEAFADAISSRGYIFIVHEITEAVPLGLVIIEGESIVVREMSGASIIIKELLGKSLLGS